MIASRESAGLCFLGLLLICSPAAGNDERLKSESAEALEGSFLEARRGLSQGAACPGCPQVKAAPAAIDLAGMHVGAHRETRWQKVMGGTPLILNRRLGQYRFLHQAMSAGKKPGRGWVVMRLNPNQYQLYACEALGSYFYPYDLDDPAGGLQWIDFRAVAYGGQWGSGHTTANYRDPPPSEAISRIAKTNPALAYRLLGDSFAHDSFSEAAYRLIESRRIDEALEILHEALPYANGRDHDILKLLITRGELNEAIRLIKDPHFQGKNGVAESLWPRLVGRMSPEGALRLADEAGFLNKTFADETLLVMADSYRGIGKTEEMKKILAHHKIPADHLYGDGDNRGAQAAMSLERFKHALIKDLVKRRRFDEARRLASGMDPYLNDDKDLFLYECPGLPMKISRNDDFGLPLNCLNRVGLSPDKALAYKDIILALAIHGDLDQAKRVLNGEFPKGDSESAAQIYDEVQEALRR